MARSALGDDVQGIAGSYATGGPRFGEWPVNGFEEAMMLDKIPPTTVDPAFVEQLPARTAELYDLKQTTQLPSDLDIIAVATIISPISRRFRRQSLAPLAFWWNLCSQENNCGFVFPPMTTSGFVTRIHSLTSSLPPKS
jgi:hypothetical protein